MSSLERCPKCPNINRCVPPNGPISSPILFCGEAPGKMEDKQGIPFVGITGREVNEHYLMIAGLSRDTTYWTNAIRCLPPGPHGRLDPKRTKDLELLESCSSHFLLKEIAQIKPKIIVPMGNFACRALEPDIYLDLHHGIPLDSKYGILFPMYHPASGVHEPKKILHIRNDWTRLKHFLRDTLNIPEDKYPNPDYREVVSVKEVNEIDPTIPMGNDTESSRALGPYFLTYSQQPGTGRLIRASRKDLLAALQKKLNRWESILLWHNYMYDKKPVTEMGLVYPDRAIRDTMIRAFHLGNLPQGLKALCFRELGMEMQDFEDLVKPYSIPKILDYYRAIGDIDWPKPDEDLIRDDKTGKWKIYKPQSMTTKMKRFWTDYNKNPDGKDPIEIWDSWGPSHARIEERLGPWPGLDIAHVPEDKSFYYAMRDSDGDLRLWPVMEHMKERAMTGENQERWRE